MASGFTDKFSVRVKKEREKIKNQKGLKGKLSYIWDYYKVPILAIVIGIAAIVSIVRAIISNNYNTSLYVSYVNCISVDLRDDTKILNNSLTEWLGIDGRKNRVRVDGYYTINPDSFTEETYTSSEKLNIMVDFHCFSSPNNPGSFYQLPALFTKNFHAAIPLHSLFPR